MSRNLVSLLTKPLFLTLFVVVAVAATAGSIMATVWTDQADYSPGSVVTISGDNSDGIGFQAGETVNVEVFGPNGYYATCEGTADENGAWTCQITLWDNDLAIGAYEYTATGATSLVTQTGTFTDARNLVLTFAGTGSGAVTITVISPATVNAPVSCSGSGSNTTSQTVTSTCFPNISTDPNGATVTFNPQANAGSVFDGWSAPGALSSSTCTGTQDPCSAVLGANPALTATFTLIAKTTPVITFGAAPTPTYGGGDFTVNATTTNTDSPVLTYSRVSGPCAFVSGATFSSTGAGTCVVRADGAATTNFNAAFNTQSVTIAPANPTCDVVGGSYPYDALPHGATNNGCTGVGDVAVSGVFTSGTQTDVPGGSVNWSFNPASDDYNTVGGSVTVTITPVDPTCDVTGGSFQYNALPHGPTNNGCTGVGDVAVSGAFPHGTQTNVPGGSVNWSFNPTSDNYNTVGGSVTVTITVAPSVTVVTCPLSVVYTGVAQEPCSANVTGVGGLNEAVTPVTHINNIDVGTATASATYAGDPNHSGSSDDTDFDITPADPVCTVTAYSVTFDTFPHTATGSCLGVLGETLAGLDLSGTTHTNAATYNDDPWTFTDVTGNYNDDSGTVDDFIGSRAALVRYIGQLAFVSSGTSATTAQVTLSASVQDPTGTALVGATMDFIETASGKKLAAGVKVSPVVGAPDTGTANVIVTLSTGQYGAESYAIKVVMTGNYDNTDQAAIDKTALVVVSKPATTNETIGAGTIAKLGTAAGTYGVTALGPATYSVGMKYTKSGANLQGKITLSIPQSDGSLLLIKSNSISSMAVSTIAGGKKSTIYTKATVTLITAGGVSIGIDSGATLRVDVEDYTAGGALADKIGFTVLSSKTSVLHYSNQWIKDVTNTWKTVVQNLLTGIIKIN